MFLRYQQVNKTYIINEIVLLAGDKLMPEMQLRQLGFTYSALDHLQKTKKESKNLKKQKIHDIFIKTN